MIVNKGEIMDAGRVFGVNAGKVWEILKKEGKPLSAHKIMKLSGLNKNEVFSGLGWLGKEGKIRVLAKGRVKLYKLVYI
jgi:hypothetical protein